MKSSKITVVLIPLVVAWMVFYFMTFVVREGKQAVITQFGKPVKFVTEPGLNFRIPFIQNVHKLEKRLLLHFRGCFSPVM